MSNHPTFGQILTGGEFRDAVHIAVAPVTAGENLMAGEHIGLRDGKAYFDCSTKIGIVDPFIIGNVGAGQRFYMFLYPNTISGLRHSWSHPAFSDEPLPPPTPTARAPRPEVIVAPPVVVTFADDDEPYEGCKGCFDSTETPAVEASKEWITDFASQLDQTYNRLMNAASMFAQDGEYTYDNSETYKNVSSATWATFWAHYEVVTGTSVAADFKSPKSYSVPYTCSC